MKIYEIFYRIIDNYSIHFGDSYIADYKCVVAAKSIKDAVNTIKASHPECKNKSHELIINNVIERNGVVLHETHTPYYPAK